MTQAEVSSAPPVVGHRGEPLAVDVMCTDVPSVAHTQSVGMAMELAGCAGAHHLGVIRDGRWVGLIDDRTLLAAGLEGVVSGEPLTVGDVADDDDDWVDPETPLSVTAAGMIDQQRDAVLVRTGDGQVIGMITVYDVLRAVAAPPRRRHYQPWREAAALPSQPVLPRPVPLPRAGQPR